MARNHSRKDGGPKIEKMGLYKLAEQLGYTPGEMTIRRFVEARDKLEGWREDLEAGVTPPDMVGMNPSDRRDLYLREIVALAQDEVKILDFFYAKKRSSDDTVEHSGGVTVQIVKYGNGSAPE